LGILEVFAAVSGAMLLLWYVTARPDLADLVRTFIPAWPLWLLVPAAFAFAVVNAAVEEAAYRGVVLGSLDTARFPAAAALVLQAVAFSALHFRAGFPRGLVGVALTFMYGLALGALRRRAGGLMAPFVTHVLTDMVIVAIVLALVRA
jgi:membrane protease YdiL (CAAX protease family)